MITVKTSRWAELSKGSLTSFIYPKTISVTPDGIKTVLVRSIVFPWMKEEELMAFARIASVRHIKGMLWDSVTIDVLGNTNTLDITGLRKGHAARLVNAINRHIGQLSVAFPPEWLTSSRARRFMVTTSAKKG